MTRVLNTADSFREDVLDGFVAAYPQYVDRVRDASGLVRAGGPVPGRVSLVVGGGSGHYPSYSGVTGTGFATGCVLGEVFTSPSAEQVYRVARAADAGAGVVLAFGNYAGDRLNFGAARERLLMDGIDTRIVYVTDDVASAPVQERDRRRGIAGTFVVYKVGGAAAERGDDLDAVEATMRAANDATSSFGVAFAGCTLPGATEPLFVVEPGTVEFGLGIHGEPGIRSAPSVPAAELASALVEAVLAERPTGARRAAVVLNGLGATKYEELFALYAAVAALLRAVDVVPVHPEVGELVTSLDMAGCSLSVTWLTAELEELWLAPADTPAFRRGTVPLRPPDGTAPAGSRATSTAVLDAPAAAPVAPAGGANAAAVPLVRRALEAMTAMAVSHEDELGRIDAVAGDGDHGLGMVRGLRAAQQASASAGGGVGSVLAAAGAAFGDRAGGTSGILWAILLGRAGVVLGDADPVTAERVRLAVRAGADAISDAGGAVRGDKTMLDALLPFVDHLDSRLAAGTGLATAWRAAATVSSDAAAATADLVPKVGRARPLAERSLGSPDAGAVSMALLLGAVGDVLTRAEQADEVTA